MWRRPHPFFCAKNGWLPTTRVVGEPFIFCVNHRAPSPNCATALHQNRVRDIYIYFVAYGDYYIFVHLDLALHPHTSRITSEWLIYSIAHEQNRNSTLHYRQYITLYSILHTLFAQLKTQSNPSHLTRKQASKQAQTTNITRPNGTHYVPAPAPSDDGIP